MISKASVALKIKDNDLRVGKDFLDALEHTVEFLVDQAIKRARWNKRRTVRSADLAYPIGDLGKSDAQEGGPKIKTEQRLPSAPPAKTMPVWGPISKEVNIARGGGIFRVGPNRGSEPVGGDSPNKTN